MSTGPSKLSPTQYRRSVSLGHHLSKSVVPLLQQVSSHQWFSSKAPQLIEIMTATCSLGWKGLYMVGFVLRFCLKLLYIYKGTEGLVFAAQEQALTTNVIKVKLFFTWIILRFIYHLCNSADETVNHVVSFCPYLAQTEYKKQYDQESVGSQLAILG